MYPEAVNCPLTRDTYQSLYSQAERFGNMNLGALGRMMIEAVLLVVEGSRDFMDLKERLSRIRQLTIET